MIRPCSLSLTHWREYSLHLGRYPVSVNIKVRMVMYWHGLVNGKESKLASIMYKCIFEMYKSTPFVSP